MTKARTLQEVRNYLNNKILEAAELTREEIYMSLEQSIHDYYNEPVFNGEPPDMPVIYSRTYKLLDSFIEWNDKQWAYQSKEQICFKVGWPDSYLSFHYKGNLISPLPTINAVPGSSVLAWFNDKSHGGTVPGNYRFWDEAFKRLNVSGADFSISGNVTSVVIPLFIDNLRNVGLNIK